MKWIANDLIAVMEPSPSQHPILRFWSTVVLLVSFGAVVVVGGVFFALSRMGEAPSTPADKTPEPQPADSLANNLLDMPEGANAPKPAPLVKPEPEERSSAEIEAAFRGMDGGAVDEKAEELPVGGGDDTLSESEMAPRLFIGHGESLHTRVCRSRGVG